MGALFTLFLPLTLSPYSLIHMLHYNEHAYLNVHTVNDYVVNIQNLSSRVFTVVFQSKQANSTEHVIFLAEDTLFEGSEFFRLQIVAARFIGQAEVLFRAVDVLNNTFVDVHIVDDDCELNGIIIYRRAYAN